MRVHKGHVVDGGIWRGYYKIAKRSNSGKGGEGQMAKLGF